MSEEEEEHLNEDEEEELDEDFDDFASFKRQRQEALLEEDDDEGAQPQAGPAQRQVLKRPYIMPPEEQVVDDISAMFIVAMHCFDYIEATQGVTVRNQKKGLDRTFDF